MAVYDPFADLAPKNDPAAKPEDTGGREWADYGRAFGSGLVSQGSNILRLFEGENTPNITAARRKLDETGEAIRTSMTPAAKKASQREVLSLGENSIWQNPRDIPQMIVGDVGPSIAISAVSGGVGGAAGRIAGAVGSRVGATTGVAAAGYGMGAGGIEQDIAETIEKARPDELGERYKQLRSENKSDRDARDQIAREAAYGYREAGGAASAVLNTMGPVGRALINKLSGRAARDAFTGGVIRTGVREAGNEAIDETITGGASEAAMRDRFGKDVDVGGLAERAARGALGGFVTGAGGRAAFGGRRPQVTDERADVIADDQQEAANARGQQAVASAPGAIVDNVQRNVQEQMQAVAQAVPPAPAAAQEAPAAQAEAIPVAQAGPVAAPQRGNFWGGDETGTPAPNALQMWDDQNGQGGAPRSSSAQPMNNMPPSNAGDVFVQQALRVAQDNGGVVDPVQISAYFAQSGRPISPQGVLQQLAPLVQRGVLRQRGIPGTNGAPTFSIAPNAPVAQPAARGDGPAVGPDMPPDQRLDRAWAESGGLTPDQRSEDAWAQSAGYMGGPGYEPARTAASMAPAAPAARPKKSAKAAPKTEAIKAKAAEKKAAQGAPSRTLGRETYKGGYGTGMRSGPVQGPRRPDGAAPPPKSAPPKPATPVAAKKQPAPKPADPPAGQGERQYTPEEQAILNAAGQAANEVNVKRGNIDEALSGNGSMVTLSYPGGEITIEPKTRYGRATARPVPGFTPDGGKNTAFFSREAGRQGERSGAAYLDEIKDGKGNVPPELRQVFLDIAENKFAKAQDVVTAIRRARFNALSANLPQPKAPKAAELKAKRRSAKSDRPLENAPEPEAPAAAQPAEDNGLTRPGDVPPPRKLKKGERRLYGGVRSASVYQGRDIARKYPVRTDLPGSTPARDTTPENNPQDKPAPSRQSINQIENSLKRKSAQSLREMAVDLAPKDRDGNPDVAAIDGVIRAVYYEGIPRPAENKVVRTGFYLQRGSRYRGGFGAGMRSGEEYGPFVRPAYSIEMAKRNDEVSLENWESDLSPGDRRRVVAILKAWRDKYGAKLDAKGRRPLVTWLTTADKVERRAAKDVATQAQLERLRGWKGVGEATETKPSLPPLLAEKQAVADTHREFKKAMRGTPASDVDALVGFVIREAVEAHKQAGPDQAVDYKGLMDLAQRRLQAVLTPQSGDAKSNPDLSIGQWVQPRTGANKPTKFNVPTPEEYLRRAEAGGLLPAEAQERLARTLILGAQETTRNVLDAPAGKEVSVRRAWLRNVVTPLSPGIAETLPATPEGRAYSQMIQNEPAARERIERRKQRREAYERTQQQRLKASGLPSAENLAANNTRARNRDPDFFSVRKPNGELKRLNELVNVGVRAYQKYIDIGREPHEFAVAAHDYDVVRKTMSGRGKNAALRPYADAVMQAAPRFEDGTITRLQDRIDAFMKGTPKGIFEANAPQDAQSETNEARVARINKMVKDYVELQRNWMNAGGKGTLLAGAKDPYARFMQRLLRLTNNGEQELEYIDPARAAERVYFMGLTPEQVAEVKAEWDALAKRQGKITLPREKKVELLARYRNRNRITMGTSALKKRGPGDFRDTGGGRTLVNRTLPDQSVLQEMDENEQITVRRLLGSNRKQPGYQDYKAQLDDQLALKLLAIEYPNRPAPPTARVVIKARVAGKNRDGSNRYETEEQVLVREATRLYRAARATDPNRETSPATINMMIEQEVSQAFRVADVMGHEVLLRVDPAGDYTTNEEITQDDQYIDDNPAALRAAEMGGAYPRTDGVPVTMNGGEPMGVQPGAYTYQQMSQALFGAADEDVVLLDRALRNRMSEAGARIEVVTPEDFDALEQAYGLPRHNGAGGMGFYLPRQNLIYLRSNLTMAEAREIFLHENVHAATISALRNDAELRRLGEALTAEAQAADMRWADVINNAEELVAYGFTNDAAAREMAAIPISDKLARQLGVQPNTSLWGAFVDFVRRVLGLPGRSTLLDGVMAIGARAAERGPSGPSGGEIARQVFNPGLLDTMSRSARDGAVNAGPSLRKTLLAFHTKTDIAAGYGKYFSWAGDGSRQYLRLDRSNNPVDQVERAGALKVRLGSFLEKEAKPLIDRLENHRNLRPEQAEKVADLLHDATTWDIDPTKETPPPGAGENSAGQKLKMERYQRLRARYVALNPVEQQVILDVKQKIRDTQAQLAEAVSRSLVKQAWQRAHISGVRGLPDQRTLESVADRALADQLTPADTAWLDEGVVEYIKEAAKGTRDVGFYVPKYRHGEWVVFGNRSDFQQLEYFDSEAEALQRARAIEDAGGYVKRVATRTFDPQGNPVPSGERGRRTDLTTRYFVEAQSLVMETFDTKAEALEAQARMQRENVPDAKVEPREAAFQNLLAPLNPKQNEMITKAVGALTSDPAEKERLLNTFRDATVRLMAGADMKHSTLRRKNTLGASRDHVRTMGRYITSLSQYMGALQFKPYEDAARYAMNDWAVAKRNDPRDNDNEIRLQVMNELNARVDSGPNEGRGRFNQAVARFTAVHFLASPSYTLMQLMQPTLMGFPVLAKLFLNQSASNIAGAMRDAHNDVGGLGMVGNTGVLNMRRAVAQWRRTDTGGVVDMLARVKQNLRESGARDAQQLSDMLTELAQTGRIDESAGIEVARVAQGEGSALSRSWRMIEEFSRGMPAAAEVYNRSLMAVAAYRMAKQEGRSDNEAYLAAEKAIIDSQFIYNPENAARAFTNAPGYVMPFLVFKKFVQAMYMQLARSVYDSVKGENEQVRKAARRQFTLMMATHASIAGVLGLPTEPFAIAAGLLAFALGEDEPWDWESEIIRGLNGVFGKETTELITRGLPRAINLDLSSRISLSGLLFMKEMENFEPKTFFGYTGEFLMGAPGGIVSGWLRAGQLYRNDADLGKVSAAFLPKAARDAINAWKMSEEGLTDSKGNPVDEGQTNWSDIMWKSLGFRSGFEANRSAAQRYAYQQDKEANRERRRLHSRWDKAETDAQKAAVQKEIDAFNKQYPAYEITDQSKQRSSAQRERQEENKTYGIPVKKGQQFDTPFNLPRPKGQSETRTEPTRSSTTPPAGERVTFDTGRERFYAAIMRAEGTDRDGDPYNEVLGYGAYGVPPKPLTEMTMAEAYDFGQEVIRPAHRAAMARQGIRTPGSSALGAFQIVGSTMAEFLDEAGLTWEDKFSPDNQRRLALVIAQRQGLGAWEGFKYHPVQRTIARRMFDLYPENA